MVGALERDWIADQPRLQQSGLVTPISTSYCEFFFFSLFYFLFAASLPPPSLSHLSSCGEVRMLEQSTSQSQVPYVICQCVSVYEAKVTLLDDNDVEQEHTPLPRIIMIEKLRSRLSACFLCPDMTGHLFILFYFDLGIYHTGCLIGAEGSLAT